MKNDRGLHINLAIFFIVICMLLLSSIVILNDDFTQGYNLGMIHLFNLVLLFVLLFLILALAFVSYNIFNIKGSLYTILLSSLMIMSYFVTLAVGMSQNTMNMGLDNMTVHFSFYRLFFLMSIMFYERKTRENAKYTHFDHLQMLVITIVHLLVLLGISAIIDSEVFLYSHLYLVIEVINISLMCYYLYQIRKIKNEYKIFIIEGCVLLLIVEVIFLFFLPFEKQFFLYLFYDIGVFYLLIYYYEFQIFRPMKKYFINRNQFEVYSKYFQKIIDRETLLAKEMNQRLISELDYAKTIQQSLLPDKKLNYRQTKFIAEYFPCERLSGDFYDIFKIDDDNIGLYVLDVSGHGISAALMTMFCNNYIKSNERMLQKYRGLKPDYNLSHFYESFNNMTFPDEMHMVIFYASYNLSTKILTYCSGGMNCQPLLLRTDGQIEYLDQSEGFPICKLSLFFKPEYKSAKVSLNKGDRLIFYTDGLIDDEKNDIFDMKGLEKFFKLNYASSTKKLNRMITQRIKLNKDHLEDDITYILMEI